MELADKICVKFSISLAKRKKEKKRRREHGEVGEKNNGFEKKSVGEKELRCSIMQEREKQRRGREGARRTGGEK
jgi:hypothetical protein